MTLRQASGVPQPHPTQDAPHTKSWRLQVLSDFHSFSLLLSTELAEQVRRVTVSLQSLPDTGTITGLDTGSSGKRSTAWYWDRQSIVPFSPASHGKPVPITCQH